MRQKFLSKREIDELSSPPPTLWCTHRPPLYLLGAVFGCSRGWRGWGEGRRARQSTVCWEILHRASFIKIFCTLFKKYVLNLFQFFVPRPGMPLTDLQRLYIALHHFSSKNFIRSSANCRKVLPTPPPGMPSTACVTHWLHWRRVSSRCLLTRRLHCSLKKDPFWRYTTSFAVILYRLLVVYFCNELEVLKIQVFYLYVF